MAIEPAQTIWVTRHATRIDVVDPAWKRTAVRPFDAHLAEQGEIEARQMAQRLVREASGAIDVIYASPFLRTVQTATVIAEALDLRIRLEPGFAEWLNPEWLDDVPVFLPAPAAAMGRRFERLDLDYVSPVTLRQLERLEDVEVRSRDTMLRLAATGENMLVVGHGGSVRFSVAALRGVDMEAVAPSSPASLYKVVRHGTRWTSEFEADMSCYMGDPETTSVW